MGLPQQMVGLLDLVAASGSAGVANAIIKPSEHEIWVINSLAVYHDDPAGGLVCVYNAYDGSSNRQIGRSGSLAQNTYTYFYNDCPQPEPWVLTYDHYINLVLTGLAAGKKIYWETCVTRFRGLPTGYGL